MKQIASLCHRYRGSLAAFVILFTLLMVPTATYGQAAPPAGDLSVNLGWNVPSFGEILTFIIRLFFVIAGLAALFYLLLGALAWVTSGGSKENVEAAQKKIIAAIIGVVLIVVVLSVIVTLERIIFRCRICFGISCPVTIPSLVDPQGGQVTTTSC